MLADTGLELVSELKAKLGWPLLQFVPVAFVAYNLLWLIYTSFFSSLRKIPGPFLARISRVWEMRKTATGNIHEIIVDLHKCHGLIVRIGPNRYDFDTMEAAKIIYRIGSTLPKADYYIPFGLPSFPNLFDVQDSARHSSIKKQFAPLYTMTTLLSYEQGVDGQTAILKEELQRFSHQKQVIDLPQFLQYYVFDVIGVITVGKSMGMMESNLDAMWHYASMMAYIPHMHAWWLCLFSLLPIEAPIQVLTEYVERQIMQYRIKAADFGDDASLKGGNNFLAKLLLMEKEGKVTSRETQQAICLNIGAESHTTANALSPILYYLYTNPQTLQCLREELDICVKVDPLSFQQSQSMPYLQAIIKEALRLHPGVGTQLTRVVPKVGLVIEGQFFPKGTEVGVNAWVLYHKKPVFGVDASEFRHERWLETGGNLNIGGSFTFGAGSRSCIDKNIRNLEMSRAIPQIVRNFDIEINRGEMIWKNECWWFVKPEYKAMIKTRAS
ncbi:Pisatin demethylase [Fusarium oxysporum f. sp. cepae]|uniref:Pisatin demethylase n=1 Tax=Fusarium oxysporum f. sp. cepae TaxID=396571 RepID=A0A3L6NP33_FUSOX|nr:Pisatin demethylase [Fusarium oxysporum f. sp. cepae]RKK31569.1 Pisatin demethylase [Fusarium oxysporum f. sp. cepae]